MAPWQAGMVLCVLVSATAVSLPYMLAVWPVQAYRCAAHCVLSATLGFGWGWLDCECVGAPLAHHPLTPAALWPHFPPLAQVLARCTRRQQPRHRGAVLRPG